MSGDDKNEQSVMLSLDEILNQDPSLGGFNTSLDDLSPSTPQDVNLDELSRIGLTQDHVRATPMTGVHLTQPLVLQEKQVHPIVKALGLSLAVLGLLAGGIFLGVQFNKQMVPKQPSVAPINPKAIKSSVKTPNPKPTSVKLAIAPGTQETSNVNQGSDLEKTKETKKTDLSSKTTPKKARSKSKWRSTRKNKLAKAKVKAKAKAKAKVEPTGEPKAEPKADPKPKVKKSSAAASLLKSLNRNQKSTSADALKKSSLPTKLTRSQILKVTRKNQRSINRCKAHTSGAVRAEVKVTVAPSGSVSKATLREPKNQIGSPLDQCLASRIKAFKFPEFNGPPMKFNLPFFL
jgi:hypothetical protein